MGCMGQIPDLPKIMRVTHTLGIPVIAGYVLQKKSKGPLSVEVLGESSHMGVFITLVNKFHESSHLQLWYNQINLLTSC